MRGMIHAKLRYEVKKQAAHGAIAVTLATRITDLEENVQQMKTEVESIAGTGRQEEPAYEAMVTTLGMRLSHVEELVDRLSSKTNLNGRKEDDGGTTSHSDAVALIPRLQNLEGVVERMDTTIKFLKEAQEETAGKTVPAPFDMGTSKLEAKMELWGARVQERLSKVERTVRRGYTKINSGAEKGRGERRKGNTGGVTLLSLSILEDKLKEGMDDISAGLSSMRDHMDDMEVRICKQEMRYQKMSETLRILTKAKKKQGDSLLDKDELVINLRKTIEEKCARSLPPKIGYIDTINDAIRPSLISGRRIPASLRAFIGFVKDLMENLPGQFVVLPSMFELMQNETATPGPFTIRFPRLSVFCSALQMGDEETRKMAFRAPFNLWKAGGGIILSGSYTTVEGSGQTGILEVGSARGGTLLNYESVIFYLSSSRCTTGEVVSDFKLYVPQGRNGAVDEAMEEYFAMGEDVDFSYEITWTRWETRTPESEVTGRLRASYPVVVISSNVLANSIVSAFREGEVLEDRILRSCSL